MSHITGQEKWQRVAFMPNLPLKPETKILSTACDEHILLSRKAAGEGMVLLKNEASLLPLAPKTNLCVFGKGQLDYVQGGGGSGTVYSPYSVSVLSALEEEDLQLCPALTTAYHAWQRDHLDETKEPGTVPEMPLTDDLLHQARDFSDIAIVVICRYSCEGRDRTGDQHDGDFYLSKDEESMVKAVEALFPRIAVVFNIGGQMDVRWFAGHPHFQAALLAWQGGMEGGHAIADILMGRVNPSGHLTDTFAEDFDAYPSSEGFHASEDYVEYAEDVYVGYRYFETIPGARQKVIYPFGYGLSYTTFDLQPVSIKFQMEKQQGAATVEVRNTGHVPGKTVAQRYVRGPKGRIDRPEIVLCAYGKTKELAAGASETLTLSFDFRDFSVFDDRGQILKSAFLLEKGDYQFLLGDSAEHLIPFNELLPLSDHQILLRAKERCVPDQLHRRLHADGTYETIECPEEPGPKPIPDTLPPDGQPPEEKSWIDVSSRWGRTNLPQLRDVQDGAMDLKAFTDHLSTEQLVHLLGGQPNRGVANTYGVGNIPAYGIPNVMTADGPAGLRVLPRCGGVRTTAFPCATLLACSFNPELIEQIGQAAAEEVLEQGIGIWLAPAMNIHRSPLCGRNFEYYSEDPLVSGKCAVAMVRGIQKVGVAGTIKHFACNNKETNRRNSDSRVSERALREIYLRGFEIAVKEAHPWFLMTSYNLINGIRASENGDLIDGILREEWGYDGAVTTDWYTFGEQWKEILAGNDLKMGRGMDEDTLEKIREGKLSEEKVRECALRILRLILRIN